MAIRGRRPKPDYMRVLVGTKKRDPKVDSLVPNESESAWLKVPPHWMNARQKEIWRYALEQAPPGLLRTIDASLFTVWCVACDNHAEAAQKVSDLGQLVASPKTGTPMQNPYVSIMNKQAQIMLKASAEMGFTPSSRTRVKVEIPSSPKPESANPYGELKRLDE